VNALRLGHQVCLAGCEIDRNGDVLQHDLPNAALLAIDIGYSHRDVERLALRILPRDVLDAVAVAERSLGETARSVISNRTGPE